MTRILLVDDDELLRRMLRLTLIKMGHVVIEAVNGNEALRLCQTEPPDIVLTDLIMPEKEGIETIRELRRLHPDVKIIAMSGGGRGSAKDYLVIAKRLGAAHTLNKPFTNEELAGAIAAVRGSSGT